MELSYSNTAAALEGCDYISVYGSKFLFLLFFRRFCDGLRVALGYGLAECNSLKILKISESES